MKILSVLCVAVAFAAPVHARPDEPTTGGKTLSEWVTLLKSPDAKKRTEAADRLGMLYEKALPALEPLSAALADSESKVRVLAAEALGKLREKGMPAIDALTTATKHDEPKTRAAAALALGQIAQRRRADRRRPRGPAQRQGQRGPQERCPGPRDPRRQGHGHQPGPHQGPRRFRADGPRADGVGLRHARRERERRGPGPRHGDERR